MTKRTVIVYGPQGCGKTLHANEIAKHFGLDKVVDGWMACQPIERGALMLTCDYDSAPPEADIRAAEKRYPGLVSFVSFDSVMKEIGKGVHRGR